MARQFGLPESTVRAIDLRYLERWAAKRRKSPLKHMGVDEIHMGKKDKFITVVSNLQTGDPLLFGRERKRETSSPILPDRTTVITAQEYRGGLCGYVAAVH